MAVQVLVSGTCCVAKLCWLCSTCQLCCALIFTSCVTQHNLCGASAGLMILQLNKLLPRPLQWTMMFNDVPAQKLRDIRIHRWSRWNSLKTWVCGKTLHNTLDKVLASDFDDFSSYICAYVAMLSECSHLSFRRILQRLVPLHVLLDILLQSTPPENLKMKLHLWSEAFSEGHTQTVHLSILNRLKSSCVAESQSLRSFCFLIL